MAKNYFFLFSLLFVLFSGCSADDEPFEEPVAYEKVSILSTNLPAQLTAGEKIFIRLTYDRPTRCHSFSGIEFEDLKDTLYYGVITTYKKDSECESEDLTASTSFEFIPEPVEFYIFKFWQGRSQQGEDQFLTIKVPVMSNSS